ncbi:hypothetical protein glysoja_004778 [Glycine soja]|nr:hypothetical protein glysoja_004778 [Glycine soja]
MGMTHAQAGHHSRRETARPPPPHRCLAAPPRELLTLTLARAPSFLTQSQTLSTSPAPLEIVLVGPHPLFLTDLAAIDPHLHGPQRRILCAGMPERKPVVGLSWQPQLPIPSSLKATDGSHTKPQTEASSTVRKSSSELVDGLFVPPNDPKKLNKLLRKQAKDTAGKNWYAKQH